MRKETILNAEVDANKLPSCPWQNGLWKQLTEYYIIHSHLSKTIYITVQPTMKNVVNLVQK